ncbi:hypothetical protein [Nocardioides sp. YIM 152315]|uniref:hypothetical protein n=1 Tax=Nocardioides sp. YIM 152315 TaxID=3031760 RepID=UPI0023DAC8CD|nr:hypothetical protein [Nocardioides sp. YIM 152315]MDF1602327.1 hypothetical protein [Nocardioides sp. YIM 152315]
MTVRAPRIVAFVTVVAAALAGCGTASDPSPPSGVDQLVIPTPSPDPDDFVAGVDNAWLPLPPGRTWIYQVVDARGVHRLTMTVADGPQVAGVDTTARVTTERGQTTTDWFAQDDQGNVWWFGRDGEWEAGTDGAEAGLAMPDRPRVGDGFRTAYLPGVVEDVVTVTAVDETVTVPAGSYDDLVATLETSEREPGARQRYWARGTGLVEEDGTGRVLRLATVSG